MNKELQSLRKLLCDWESLSVNERCNCANILEKALEALEIIKGINEIKIDLRDEIQMSFITIGNKILTISYKNAKLLKEVLL